MLFLVRQGGGTGETNVYDQSLLEPSRFEFEPRSKQHTYLLILTVVDSDSG